MRKIIAKTIIGLAVLATLSGALGCNKFLNVVPDDGLATMETAFNLRSTAIRYLATCYSYMTGEGAPGTDYGMLTGDELWDLVGRVVTNTSSRVPQTLFNIARGFQSASTVYGNDWSSMYEGIRCCDILMENIQTVPDMDMAEMMQWTAEAKFLKAYFHFNLVRKWGPIPIIRESLPIDSDVETVRVYRDNIDDCFDYILQLLDEAMPYLPLVNPSVDEYGRITQVACAGLRARVAAYAASPLFNGNEEEASLVDNRGKRLFPSKTDEQKAGRWAFAVKACEDALELCKSANMRLYTKEDVLSTYRMCDTLATSLAIRNAFNARWNSELVWGNTQTSNASVANFQQICMPNLLVETYTHALGGYKIIGVPLKIAEQFYTNKGLPIANDNDWAGLDSNELMMGDSAHKYYIEEGYTTVRLNFNREPRYYASLGFDGGTWMGMMSNYNDIQPENLNVLKCRIGGVHAKTGSETGPVTGFFPKKLFPFQCTMRANNTFTSYWFPWPMIRLSDLYLLYAECINEVEGPDGPHSAELFARINAIRERAGIPTVQKSWDEYSNRPGYYKTKEGMRDIIHRERLNELAFESQRFWDLRRWKEAPAEYQKGIYGYTVTASSPEDYYVKKFISSQDFGLKNYFWPINTATIEVNPNLVQNIGW